MRKGIPARNRLAGREAAIGQTLQAAVAAIGAGKLDEAARTLRSNALALGTPVGRNILGDIHLKQGKPGDALKAFDAAIKLAPDMPEAHCNRAAALQDLRRHEEALAAADRALRYRAQYAAAHFNRGNALKALARPEEAVEAFSRALALRPDLAEALLNRGLAVGALGRWREALADFQAALVRRPGYVAAHIGRASAYRGLHDPAAGLAAIDAALALEPGNTDAALVKADVLVAAGRREEALAVADALVAGDPGNDRAHAARAQALRDLKRHDEAVVAAAAAVELAPDSDSAHVALAMALSGAGRLDDSLAALDAAERLGARDASYLHARAVAIGGLGDPAEALGWFDRAVALEPDNAALRQNRSFAYLALGRFADGWPEYEWRLKKREPPYAKMEGLAPRWAGEDLKDRKLLVYAEQGHGDSIQFTRYLPLVAARGGTITLLVQEALAALYEANFPDFDVTAKLGERSGYDFQISLMSLPFVFGTTLETVPGTVPYLRADAACAAKWRERIGGDGFRIGVVWQGNPRYDTDRDRSFRPAEFRPLAGLPGVRLISLQWTGGVERSGELPDGMAIETLGDEIENNPDGFREVAAAMANLDLLVMSDTGPTHLAGALGRPVWVALAKQPDWRWMRAGATTPWYPTMRLFRQTTRGDWPGVFAEIAAEVRTLIGMRRGS